MSILLCFCWRFFFFFFSFFFFFFFFFFFLHIMRVFVRDYLHPCVLSEGTFDFIFKLRFSNLVVWANNQQPCFCVCTYIYIYIYHVVRLARISLTLSLHVSLSFIASGRSSGSHPVSSHSCCVYVQAGRPAFDWPYAGVHRSTSLTISYLLLQQCPACLVRLACIVFVTGGR